MASIRAPCGWDRVLRLRRSHFDSRRRVPVALIETVVGAVAGQRQSGYRSPTGSISGLAGFGAILLTFLAGAEIDPRIVKKHFWSNTLPDRDRRLHCALPDACCSCAFRRWMIVAADADRRDRIVDHTRSRSSMRK